MSDQNAAKMLKKFLKAKIKANPQYSLRSFARDIKLSPAFVSGMLKGTRRVPFNKLNVISKVLGLDDFSLAEVRKQILFDQIKDKDILKELYLLYKSNPLNSYAVVTGRKKSLLKEWYYVALLDLLTCKGFEKDEATLAKKLGVSVYAVKEALVQLNSLGLISEQDGKLVKSETKMQVPTRNSESDIRRFHSQMIEKAKLHLLKDTTDHDFQKRLITGLTLACDTAKLEKLKAKITEAIYEIANEASEGECDEVYQFNVQFFPLTR